MHWQNPVHASGRPAAASAQGYGPLGQEVAAFAAAVQEGKKALLELLQETLLLSPVGPDLSVVAPYLPGLSGGAQAGARHRAGGEQRSQPLICTQTLCRAGRGLANAGLRHRGVISGHNCSCPQAAFREGKGSR